jgi:lipid-A-disaccharide synthase
MAKKLYIIAGEASGDLHGSNVMRELYRMDPDIEIRFWGGDAMEKEGGTMAKHIRDLAFMGFVEVLMNLRTIMRNMRFCKEDILDFQPDAILFIDYPGFNLRIAKWAKEQGFHTHFYISPSVWAWKQSRVHDIRRDIDHLYSILPFEQEFFSRFEYPIHFVGHPLLDAIERFEEEGNLEFEAGKNDERPIIALLPGSRRQEISKKLPLMLEAVRGLGQYRIIIAGAPNMPEDFYRQFMSARPDTEIFFGKTYAILRHATGALVTSGTATLETALFEVPEVVCYVGSPISYAIAKRLIHVKYISLVNLILDRPAVAELIQYDCTPERMKAELLRVLPEGEGNAQLREDYRELKKVLGSGGASRKVAQSLLKTI